MEPVVISLAMATQEVVNPAWWQPEVSVVVKKWAIHLTQEAVMIAKVDPKLSLFAPKKV